MEMVAAAEVGTIGKDLTPPLSPLSFSLHDSFLTSHCASCFSPLPPNPLHCLFYYYCSHSCSSSHPPFHLHHLRRLSQNTPFNGETSDLRTALLLLLHIKRHQPPFVDYNRICGLMTNRHKLLATSIDNDDDFSLFTRIKKGSRAIAIAMDSDDRQCLLEEAVLCVVITNAVEVQDRVGRSVGIALYDISFSWINHSCYPNSCYRFLPQDTEMHTRTVGRQCLIRPASSDGIEISDLATGWREIRSGPRIVVRSIKQIKKGEQVTIAYTDLLQPKDWRQLELWSKYRFTCCCRRCVAVPLTYVDHCLQQVSTFSVNGKLLIDVVGAEESVKEYVDDAIHVYLSFNDAKSCCKKLENVLLNGFLYEQEQVVIRLHPQHHLSLNAYTTLASAYKVHATAMDESVSNLKMNKISAAYSLLLALLTHPFFLSETCLIACVSHFWIGAGESLLNLARSLKVMHHSGSELPSFTCSGCGLMDAFESPDFNGCHRKVLNEFVNCSITGNMAAKVWELLVHGNGYLESVGDPTLDFFSKNISNIQDLNLNLEHGVDEVFVFRVGVHCLLYGGMLSNISGGHDSHFSGHVRRLLYGH